MRMRRKKHLDDRMEACDDLMINMLIGNRHFGATEEQHLLDLPALFGRERPVELEIGCGKGGFICELAARRPETDFLAVEKYGNVLVTACEAVRARGLTNVRFLWGDAEYLPRFLPAHSLSRLYLNFSTPYPKKQQATHRLTHGHFLQLYRGLLQPGAAIEQKTDDRGLCQFSLEQYSAAGYTLRHVSLDLHAEQAKYPDNIVTEYESRFVAQGLPIYRLEATAPKGD